MRPAIVIVADDLTGAADCGITCTVAGLQTVVAFGDLGCAATLSADVVSFDTDTRREACRALKGSMLPDLPAGAVARLCARGVTRVLYKKIDSTLRGNFAVEIAAARRAAAGLITDTEGNPPLAIVAPAFPGTGRTTRGGRMFLNGTPLEDSAVWSNEKITGVADVPALLADAAGMRAKFVDLETVRSGAKALAAALDELAAAGVEAVVGDAETEDDLRALAEAAARLKQPAIFAGSAGLARPLPAAFGLSSVSQTDSKPGLAATPTKPRSNSLLFVVGSMSQVSREGLQTLAGEPGVRVITLPPAALRDGPSSTAWQGAARLVEEGLAGSQDVAVALGLDEGVNLGESAFLSGALAQFLLPLAPRFGGLFLTGGETARALLNAAGAAGIRLLGEVEPGVPMGTAEGWGDLPVITKAGAFGNAGTLVRCRAALREFLSAA